jgi:transcriptional regulator with XRE-family HTH domain
MLIQQKIKELVKRKKGVAIKLAEYLGKDAQYVYDIYQKNKKLDYLTLKKIAEYFNLPMEYFNESYDETKQVMEPSIIHWEMLVNVGKCRYIKAKRRIGKVIQAGILYNTIHHYINQLLMYYKLMPNKIHHIYVYTFYFSCMIYAQR